MKIIILIFAFAAPAFSQELPDYYKTHPRFQKYTHIKSQVVSPEDIINSVHGELENVSCGINQIGQQVVDRLYNERKRKMLEIIDNALEEWDMECLSSLLDRGFQGFFNINIPNLDFCRYARDWIEENTRSKTPPAARKSIAAPPKRKVRVESW